MKKIRLAIIDDHVVVRMGLKFAIRLATDFEFAGERGGGEGAGDFVADCGADVTLLDIRMPRVDGIAALRDIRARNPDAKVVMAEFKHVRRIEVSLWNQHVGTIIPAPAHDFFAFKYGQA